MAWYDEAVFYHIYPLGLTGAPEKNSYGEVRHALKDLAPWITHMKRMGFNALYIGPLFESQSHGYDTTDYKKVDSRLGDNEDLKEFVSSCHAQGIRVVLDGVFNHTGRDFFAFQDLLKNREKSPYKDWYCNVNFWGNNEYNDGLSYDNWGGFNLLVKLNQRNPDVKDYILNVIRFWVSEFDIDGIRLDAADVLDFDFMRALRALANEVKPEFWLMGEVIHGEYSRWVNDGTLHSVTNYHLQKALYSGHNDHNYFEIAHTVKRLNDMGMNRPEGFRLYNFADNHDVERIHTRLQNKAHFAPLHVLLYTLPGIPSVYYGSEFAIDGRKEYHSDAPLRPALNYEDYKDAFEKNPSTALIAALGRIRQQWKALSYGDYRELLLTNRQYAFSRNQGEASIVVTVNNDNSDYVMTLPAGQAETYVGALSGQKVSVSNGQIAVNVKANSGEIWVPDTAAAETDTEDTREAAAPETDTENTRESAVPETDTENTLESSIPETDTENTRESAVPEADTEVTRESAAPETGAESTQEAAAPETGAPDFSQTVSTVSPDPAGAGAVSPETASVSAVAPEPVSASAVAPVSGGAVPPVSGGAVPASGGSVGKAYEDGIIAGLQEAVIALMERNGPVTDQMRRDVYNNSHHGSLITWIKSFIR